MGTRCDSYGIWRTRDSSQLPPRKVIVGTMVRGFWGESPGLDRRLGELTGMIGTMARQARSRYGRGLDLAVLPESVVNGEPGSDAFSHSNPLSGPVEHAFAEASRRHHC